MLLNIWESVFNLNHLLNYEELFFLYYFHDPSADQNFSVLMNFLFIFLVYACGGRRSMHTCVRSIQTFSPSIMRILGIVRLAKKY